jgi:succinate dehydrogenase hydrophobic anchor subunit
VYNVSVFFYTSKPKLQRLLVFVVVLLTKSRTDSSAMCQLFQERFNYAVLIVMLLDINTHAAIGLVVDHDIGYDT